MDDYAEQRLTEFVENASSEMDMSDARDAFAEKMEVIEERAQVDLDEKTKVDYAIGMLSSDDIRSSRTGIDGERMQLKILSVGQRGTWEGHPIYQNYDGSVVTAHGIAIGDFNQDGQPKAARVVVFLKDEHLDLHDAMQKFHPKNKLVAEFEVEEAWNVDGAYRAHSTDDTALVESNFDEIADDDVDEFLDQTFPAFTLAELAEDGKGLSSYDPDSGYTNDWGVDIVRFRGRVNSYYINDEGTWGVYTMMDDSLTADDLEKSRLQTERQNLPGLSVQCIPDHHMNYGENSTLDVYGVTEIDDNGNIIMRAAGIVPIIPTEMKDEQDADEGVQATETTL